MPTQPIDVINSLGYLGIFLLIFLFPVPQEIVLPLAGFMAAQGKLNLVYTVIAGVAGSIAGALPWYYAGRYIGETRLRTWTEQHGRWIKLSTADVHKAKSWFDKYGSKAVLFSQFVPGFRTLVALPAGISKMNSVLFLLYLTISAVMGQTMLTSAGYLLENNYKLIDQYLGLLSRIVTSLLVVAVIIWFVKRKK